MRSVAEFHYRSEITLHPDGSIDVKTDVPTEQRREEAEPYGSPAEHRDALLTVREGGSCDEAMLSDLERIGLVQRDDAGTTLTTTGALIAPMPQPLAESLILLLLNQ